MNIFAKFMFIFFLLMFTIVYISDYKTWMPTFRQTRYIKENNQQEETEI